MSCTVLYIRNDKLQVSTKAEEFRAQVMHPDPNLPTVNLRSYKSLASGIACTGKPWHVESADHRRPAYTPP